MKPIINKNRKRYFITGGGCSGTSFVAGALAPHIDLLEDDSRTHEHSDVKNINRGIIGGQGKGPEIRKILDSENYLLGMKDPRFVHTLDEWLSRVSEDDDVYLICCFRTPKYHAISAEKTRRQMADKNRQLIKHIEKFCEL